jgi:Flp pilus assembly protein TadB
VSPDVLAAGAAWAAWLAMPAGPHHPLVSAPAHSAVGRRDDRLARRWLWSGAAGLGSWAFISGVTGIVAGAVVCAVLWVVLGRVESPAQRARRVGIRADLPHVVGLLAAAVRGGLPPADGLALVCAALPGPASDALTALPPRILLGVDPAEVWASLEGDLAPLGRTLSRSARTGAPVAEALDRLAGELAAHARAEREDAARRVGVQAAVPLGLCLLPAFLLLGIVPVVAGLVGALTG